MKLNFDIKGMTCAACSARVEKVTAQVQGVDKVEVNLLAGKMIVHVQDKTVTDAIIKAVSDAGYQAHIHGVTVRNIDKKDESENMKRRIIGSVFFLIILMYFTMGHMMGLPMPSWYHGEHNTMTAALLQFMLTVPIIYLNRVYYKRGLKALFNRAPNMDSLIAVGSGAALIYGIVALLRISYSMGHNDWDTVRLYGDNLYFESAATILTLISVGKFLEERAKGKTGDAIRQLLDLSPKTAIVQTQDGEIEVPVEQVKVGNVVIVRSGGRIPVDGTIVSGRGAIDQSSLTGESVPVEKTVGDTVAAATINSEGYLEIRADKVGEDTTLYQVIRLVEEAGGSKAPIARLADKIAGVFVPIVMSIAVIAFVVWMLAGQTLEFALTTGIAVLVISCPCALGLATPVAIMVGTGRGARMGILFKNAQALESLHAVDTVVLDKTGTLTVGKPSVTDILPADTDEKTLLSIAAALESKSEHPFAKAIISRFGSEVIDESIDFATLPGLGVSGVIHGVKYYGGNKNLMDTVGAVVPEYSELTIQGKTPLYFANEDGEFLGVIAAADVLKEDSASAVDAMHAIGIRVVMLTGDNEKTAKAVGEAAGVDQVISDVLPADKAAQILKLQNEGRNVLMVGDGINDAPALATANVGMAIGAGTDIAIESADIVLMKNSLQGVSDAISLSRATIRNIRQNLFWAFFYNALGIPIAAGVLYPTFGIQLSPMLGAAAMSFSSVFVVTNALRLRLFKTKKRDKREKITMETVITVEGMMCTHCKARVESVCKAVPAVVDAQVDLQAKTVTVTGAADVDALKKAIIDAGYEVIA